MQERFYKVVGKVLKLWERLYCREKVGKVSKFQERLFNDNFKAGNGEERKGKGKLSVPPLGSMAWLARGSIGRLVLLGKFLE